MHGPVHLTTIEREVLQRFADAARVLAGSRLIELRVYGSRVRGEGHTESHVDVFVLVDAYDRTLENDLDDLASDLHVETGVMLDPRVWGQADWQLWLRHERALALNIEKDGVPL